MGPHLEQKKKRKHSILIYIMNITPRIARCSETALGCLFLCIDCCCRCCRRLTASLGLC